jgi:hypothetical protein
MNSKTGYILRRTLTLLALTVLVSIAAHAQFTEPTAEELKMTAQPEVPGAAAVYLNREEITDDGIHTIHIYARLKVLTEAGKEYADVEVPYYSKEGDTHSSVIAIQARTIHPDGKVIPFSSKPYEKLISRHGGEKRSAKVFSLPDVQVGSILEYRYSISYDENYFLSPQWNIQSDLFVRKAHYEWKPTTQELMGADGKITHYISWSSLLPHGVQVTKEEMPAAYGDTEPHRTYKLTMTNVPPIPDEAYMPPMRSLSYRVWLYYAAYTNAQEFWQATGKTWSKAQDKFINASSLGDVVSKIVSPGDSEEQKLRKIYAAVMTIENTDFTRAHTSSEDQAATGHAEIHSAADIWQLKRGSSDQITDLFIGLARASQMKAYAMDVADRSQRLFLPDYMSLGQLDDEIAIVNVGGKEQYFDPGSRYCPYGHLAWQHTSAGGLRQTEGGTTIAQASPAEAYKFSTTQRAADLVLAKDDTVSGTVTLVFSGAPALQWRQRALETDDTGIRTELKDNLAERLPAGMDIEVSSIGKLTEYESPLVVQYSVKGNLGSLTGKRIILPADPFSAKAKEIFPQEKRIMPIYFHFPYEEADITRVRFPAGFTVESAPTAATDRYTNSSANAMSVQATSNSITIRREMLMADTLVPEQEYAALRAYYSKMEQKAQESVVLNVPAPTPGN